MQTFTWVIVTDLHGFTRLKILPKGLEECRDQSIYFSGLFNYDLLDEPIDNFKSKEGVVNVSTFLNDLNIRRVPWVLNTALIIGDIQSPLCPRKLLKQIISEYTSRNLEIICGMEMEWTLLKAVKADCSLPEQALYPMCSHSTKPYGNPKILKMINDICDACSIMDIGLDSIHSEFGESMFEMALSKEDPLTMADNVQLYRMIVKYAAENTGFTGTFAPKIFKDKAGTGAHVHISLRDATSKRVLTDMLLDGFLAGILYHMKDCSLIMLPNLMSFERLTGAQSTCKNVCYDIDTRSCAIRIVRDNDPENAHLEIRTAGGDVNPYLLLNFILRAGLYGMESEIDLKWKPKQIIQTFPRSLEESARLFLAPDSKARNLFKDDFIQHFGKQRLFESTQKKNRPISTYAQIF